MSSASASGWKMASFSFILSLLERVRERQSNGKRKVAFSTLRLASKNFFGRLGSFSNRFHSRELTCLPKLVCFWIHLAQFVIVLVFAGRLLEVLFESEALSQDGLDVLLGRRKGNLVDELGGVG